MSTTRGVADAGAAAASAPLVSILIPTYNRSGLLAEALDSAIAQAGPPLEILVVDNASTDDTERVTAGRAAADPRVRYFRNEANLGMVGNWNRAASHARGRYLVLLSDDDRLLPGMVQRAAAVLEANPAVAICHGTTRYIDAAGKVRQERHAEDHRQDFVERGGAYLRRLFDANPIILASAMLRRDAVPPGEDLWAERIGPLADYHLWLRLLVRHDVAFVAAPAAEYRWHPSQITVEQQEKFAPGRVLALAEALEAGAAAGHLDAAFCRKHRARISKAAASVAGRMRGERTPARQADLRRYLGLALRLSPRALLRKTFLIGLLRLGRWTVQGWRAR